jgi:hypothetical protein
MADKLKPSWPATSQVQPQQTGNAGLAGDKAWGAGEQKPALTSDERLDRLEAQLEKHGIRVGSLE